MSDQNNSQTNNSNPNQGPRRRRRPNKNRSRAGQGQTPQQANQNKGPRPNKSKNQRNKRRRSGPRLSLEERVVKKYENLLDQHIQARRKYYELFNRADPKQKDKLERVFTRTLVDLRNFEERLEGKELEVFEQRYVKWGELDHTYTSNHGISTTQEVEVPPGEEKDPHYLESQRAAAYKKDQEESTGTYEDYMSYKESLSK